LDAVERLSLLRRQSFKAFVFNNFTLIQLLLAGFWHPSRLPQEEFVEKSLNMMPSLRFRAAVLALAVFSSFALKAQTIPDPPPPKSADSTATATDKPPAPAPSYDPLLDLPPLPHNKVSLLGGTIAALDQVQNNMVVQPFGGKQKLRMNLDMRTHVYNDGKPAEERDLKTGQRIYVDTMLNSNKVFAKSIWIQSTAGSGSARGQVLSYDSRRRILSVRDEVSTEPIDFRLAPDVTIQRGHTAGSFSDLATGSLVSLSFGPQQGRSGYVREVTVLAEPGAVFTFLGKVIFVDLSKKLMAIFNQNDNKNYDLSVEAIPAVTLETLREGSTAAVSATFDGTHYVARTIEVVRTSSKRDDQK
jgi:hypothetical protein